jgi:hypothetical protein
MEVNFNFHSVSTFPGMQTFLTSESHQHYHKTVNITKIKIKIK